MRKVSFAEFLSSFTGVGIPIFSLQWNPPEPERRKARRIIAFLEGRQVLFAPHNWEMPDECVSSCEKIKDFVTTELGSIDPSTELGQRLTVMRLACRDFVNGLRERGIDIRSKRSFRSPHVRDGLTTNLQILRTVMGQQIFWIMMTYGLEVEESLASAFPPELTGRP